MRLATRRRVEGTAPPSRLAGRKAADVVGELEVGDDGGVHQHRAQAVALGKESEPPSEEPTTATGVALAAMMSSASAMAAFGGGGSCGQTKASPQPRSTMRALSACALCEAGPLVKPCR